MTTTGGLKCAISSKSCAKRVLDECVTKLAHQGPNVSAPWVSLALAKPSVISVIQVLSTSMGRALGVGNAPTMPALQAAKTISGPEIKNIGAAKTGSRNASGFGWFMR